MVDVLADRSYGDHDKLVQGSPKRVDVVSRDRAGLSMPRPGAWRTAEARSRSPTRFHLMQNFRETVERQLSGGYEAPIRDSGSAAAAIRRCRRFPHARIVVLMRSLGHALIRRDRQAVRQPDLQRDQGSL